MKVSLALSGQGPHTGCSACHTSTWMGIVLILHTVMEVELRKTVHLGNLTKNKAGNINIEL
jgi:hypothetical protein